MPSENPFVDVSPHLFRTLETIANYSCSSEEPQESVLQAIRHTIWCGIITAQSAQSRSNGGLLDLDLVEATVSIVEWTFNANNMPLDRVLSLIRNAANSGIQKHSRKTRTDAETTTLRAASA